jgi:hypothetical protein
MVRYLKHKNISDLSSLWLFLKSHVDPDFYLTEDNRRVFITTFLTLKRLLRQSHELLVSNEDGGIDGIIMLWKGISKHSTRKYIKINAKNESVAKKLLTVLLWKHSNQDLYIKINKQSPFIRTFKAKSFSFLGGRGKELLLVRRKGEHKWR